MSINKLSALLLNLFLFTYAFGGKSNTYIRLHDTLSYNLSMAEDVIRSAGGKMKHQFPPDEIICYLPEVDYAGIEAARIKKSLDKTDYCLYIGYRLNNNLI